MIVRNISKHKLYTFYCSCNEFIMIHPISQNNTRVSRIKLQAILKKMSFLGWKTTSSFPSCNRAKKSWPNNKRKLKNGFMGKFYSKKRTVLNDYWTLEIILKWFLLTLTLSRGSAQKRGSMRSPFQRKEKKHPNKASNETTFIELGLVSLKISVTHNFHNFMRH